MRCHFINFCKPLNVLKELCSYPSNKVLLKPFELLILQGVDYEDKMSRNLSIIVENEVPYFSCRVKTRTSRGLWDVETYPKEFRVPYNVTIDIEDVNDPPEFVTPIKEIWIAENTEIGTLLETFSVIDPDKKFESKFQ